MDPEGIVGVGSAALSVVGALTAGVMANRSARQAHELERQKERETQREIAERILQQYRDPLLDAAHTLQGRLFNIMAQDFLGAYLNHPDPDERRYARDYTVYAIAEYLCWVEILRRELRFHDLGDVAAQPGSPASGSRASSTRSSATTCRGSSRSSAVGSGRSPN